MFQYLVINKVHCHTVNWLCIIWFSKYSPSVPCSCCYSETYHLPETFQDGLNFAAKLTISELQDSDVGHENFLNVTNRIGNTTYEFTITNPESGNYTDL